MDLTTSYLCMTLKNPIVVSPSPISEPMANIRKLEDAGAFAKPKEREEPKIEQDSS